MPTAHWARGLGTVPPGTLPAMPPLATHIPHPSDVLPVCRDLGATPLTRPGVPGAGGSSARPSFAKCCKGMQRLVPNCTWKKKLTLLMPSCLLRNITKLEAISFTQYLPPSKTLESRSQSIDSLFAAGTPRCWVAPPPSPLIARRRCARASIRPSHETIGGGQRRHLDNVDGAIRYMPDGSRKPARSSGRQGRRSPYMWILRKSPP